MNVEMKVFQCVRPFLFNSDHNHRQAQLREAINNKDYFDS